MTGGAKPLLTVGLVLAPWQLRPVTMANVLRSDTSAARYDSAAGSGSTVATTLLGSYATTRTSRSSSGSGSSRTGPPEAHYKTIQIDVPLVF
jgi:hypothetical protein